MISLRSQCCRLAAALLLLAAAGSASAQVTLYRDEGYRGESETFHDDIPDLSRTRLGNDNASSISVRPGCVVTLYRNADFRGTFTELDRDEPSLARSAVGGDRVSSLTIRCDRGGGWHGPGRGGVALYRDEHFGGGEEWFRDDVPELSRTGIGNDAASSLRASRDCRVRLYEDELYGGRYAELGGDVERLAESRIGNDRASSLQIRCSGDRRPWGPVGPAYPDRPGRPGWSGGRPPYEIGVTLYRDTGYRGERQSFDGDVADLQGSTLGNDQASSVRVPRGCRVVLFADAGYRGDAIEVRDDIADLRRTRIGNDRVSSLRVDCR